MNIANYSQSLPAKGWAHDSSLVLRGLRWPNKTKDASSRSSFWLLFIVGIVTSLKTTALSAEMWEWQFLCSSWSWRSLTSMCMSGMGSKGKSISVWSHYLAGRRLFLILCLVCFSVLQTTWFPLGMMVPILTGYEFCPCTNLLICLWDFLQLMRGTREPKQSHHLAYAEKPYSEGGSWLKLKHMLCGNNYLRENLGGSGRDNETPRDLGVSFPRSNGVSSLE